MSVFIQNLPIVMQIYVCRDYDKKAVARAQNDSFHASLSIYLAPFHKVDNNNQ